jgi:antitoxin (DNA-binding transcriptional repressor) of toxin-antitoxin stability system
MQVNMHEAKSRLSQLAELAQKGETVIIAKAGKPCVELRPCHQAVTERKPGRLAGSIRMSDDFEDTPAEVISAFEGGG